MRCKKYRKLIYLNREGEMTSAESRELVEHLAGCADCSALLGEVQQAADRIAKIREVTPHLSRPEELVESALDAIRRPTHTGPAWTLRELGERSLDRLLSPGVRLAIATLAVALVLFFGFQAGTTISSLSKLEEKMTFRSGAAHGPAVAYRLNTAAMRTDPLLRQIGDHFLLEYGLRMNGSFLVARGVLGGFASGSSPGPFELAHLASIIGSDPGRLRLALKAVEGRVTTVLLF